MGHLKIYFCKKCRALDYAKGRCPKCGSADLDEAGMEFLAYGVSAVRSPLVPVILTCTDAVEKIGWD